MNVLMIGNSFCYYYTRELHGIAKAAGVDMKIYNVYYSGCSLDQHWEWYQNQEAKYEFFTTDDEGRRSIKKVDLRYCMAAEEKWDVISLQNGSRAMTDTQDSKVLFDRIDGDLGNLLKMLRARFPESHYYWHHTWANQVGFQGPLNKDPKDVPAWKKVLSPAVQHRKYQLIKETALMACKKYGLDRIPSGDAWQYARANPAVGDVLCGKNGNYHGDYYHDGDIGGGRYLNACVWFETLTGKSCLGNPWRPEYEMSEEKITALQDCAHRAVNDMKRDGV